MNGSRDDGSATDSESRLPTSDTQQANGASVRLITARILGLVGIVLYNWWIWVLVATNLLTDTDEFFSDLEATGRPDATLFQHFDLAAGFVLLVALLLRGPWGPKGKRKEWRWFLLFAVASAVGGHYSYACPEGLSPACRNAEWHLQLPSHHYVHVVSGIVEFAAMTIAVYLAWKRTREDSGWVARSVKATAVTMLIGYPLLAVAYLTDNFGAVVEPIFFVCFSVMVAVEQLEPRRRPMESKATPVS
ncbi:MAG TPA: DUF998 domain-containing protein [Acidimicrobiales bacterium]|nr:DUF998 domain-containing protein [Acidimicrobiales bacterium]